VARSTDDRQARPPSLLALANCRTRRRFLAGIEPPEVDQENCDDVPFSLDCAHPGVLNYGDSTVSKDPYASQQAMLHREGASFAPTTGEFSCRKNHDTSSGGK